MMKELISILIIIFFATNSFSQHGQQERATVTGTVSFNNNPVAGSTVMLQELKDSSLVKVTATDSVGKFRFEAIDPGTYFITVQYIAAEDFRTPAFVIDHTHKELRLASISLGAAVKSMKEVVVSGRKPLIEMKTGLIAFNIENSILSTGSTAWDILNKAPAVKTDEQGDVRLRGNSNAAIMINNKLVNLSGEDLVILLRSISSENINRVEIISNPSSKYDAEGTGGIINIILKKNKEEGFNGVANMGYEQSTYAKYTAGLLLNYKNKNLSVTGNYAIKYGDYLTVEYLDQQFAKQGNTTFYNETLNRFRNQQTNNYKVDINYALDKKSSIGILVDGYFVNRNNIDLSRTPITNQSRVIDSTFLSHINIDGRNAYLTLGANYRKEIDTAGRSLSIDMDYLTYHSTMGSLNTNDLWDAYQTKMRPASIFRSNTDQQIKIFTSKLDYTHPLEANTMLQSGAKATITQTDNAYVFENKVHDEFLKDDASSDHFIYTENIFSIYGDITKTIGNLTVEGGLRGEYTNTNGNSVNVQHSVNRSYFKVFPTVYLHQKVSDNYQVELNYGKRIRRPSYADLNPFRYYSTPFSFSQGNPFLQPEFTNYLEMIHTFKDRYFISVYYTSSRDQFIQIPEQDIEQRTIAFNRVNLNSSKSFGISLELPFEFASWWQSYNSADVSHDKVSSRYLNSRFAYEKTMVNINSTQSFVLSELWAAELRANYRSPGISGLFHLGPYSEVAVGFKRKLLKNKASLGIVFSDIFRGTIMSAHVNYLDQNSVASTNNDLRSIRLNFSYKFGSSKAKQRKEREAGNRDEQKRIAR